ncbi:MAG TPA: O-antigen ligase family protein [Kofleriaceae bacterium]|nr:O-antigen ligase family protein [Kofleriaceae bacterium]
MRPRDRISLAIGGTALLMSVLGIGGAPRWIQAVVAALIALALVMQVGSRRRLDHASPLVVLLGLAIALTAVQLIPLPAGLLDALDPRGMELRGDGAALAGTSPWQAISLDAAGTLRALAFFVSLLGVALLGLRVASSERGRYLVLAAVAVTCGLAAAVTGVHTLLKAESLYGVYRPEHAAPLILGPLLNTNHLGGLMAIGAVLAVGLAFYQRQAVQLRVLWVVIAIGCSATAMASLSRGATLGLALGVATAIALYAAGRIATANDDGDRRHRALITEVPITIVIAAGLAVAVYLTAGKVADQLENTSLTELGHPLSKYEAWRSALQLVGEAPWLGIGRGAIEPVFTRVHAASAYVTFSHLENEYVQAVVEWGIPGAVLLGLALAWCIRTAARRWRDGPLAAAAIGACAAILFQSSVDFGIELLGLAVPVVLIATTVLGVRLRESRAIGPRLARAGVVVALVGAAAVLLAPVSRSVQEDHDRLAVAEEPGPGELAALRDAIERHPLDYLAYGETAAVMLRTGDPRAAKFLNHALALHPTHPGLHRLAARMLIASGRRSQAAVEYALALRGTLAPAHLIAEIVTLLPEADLAAAAIPVNTVDPAGSPHLAGPDRGPILHALSEQHRDDVAERWLLRVIQGAQHDLAVIDHLYRLAMERGDLAIAEQAARRRLAESRTATSRIQLARVLFKRQQYDQVLNDLADVSKWTGRLDQQAEAWLLVCDAQIEQRAWDPALECLHKLDGSGILPPGNRAGVVQRLAIVDEHRTSEAKQRAIEQMERALRSPAK